jgi:hypothetical protein
MIVLRNALGHRLAQLNAHGDKTLLFALALHAKHEIV